VLINIEHALVDLISDANKRKVVDAVVESKKLFEAGACFVRAGEAKKPSAKPSNRGQIGIANDWKLLVDYEHRQYVFPPTICATNQRPDAVIWSMRSRAVILLELTVPAEEGLQAAHLRKEAKYTKLLESISATNFWKPQLLTLDVGARGLVATRTYRAFTILGFTAIQTKKLCKSLSEVAARCSYAIFLAHKHKTWIRSDLVDISATKIEAPSPVRAPTKVRVQEAKIEPKEANIDDLRRNNISVLYHFTDAANLNSIREHGLLSASCLNQQSLNATMNSDEKSRAIDKQKGLENFVRLSFNNENPMQYIAKNEGRISRPVMLQIKLEVVSKQDVLFSDCNATRHDAIQSCSPDVVRFNIVKAPNQFGVKAELQRFFQAEVLVPSPVPPNMIVFPNDVAPSANEEPKPKLPKTVSTVFCKAKRSKVSSSSTSEPSSTTLTSSTASIVLLAEKEAATSETLQSTVISVLGGEGGKLFVGQDVATECALLGASTSRAPDCTIPAPVPADPVPVDPVSAVDAVPVPAAMSMMPYPSQCYVEHKANEFCSDQYIWIRGPAPAWWSSSVSAPATAERTSPSVPAVVPVAAALPGAKLLAARGRNDALLAPVAAAKCELSGAIKARRARDTSVPVADCMLPERRSCTLPGIALFLLPLPLLLLTRFRE
jgi:hypothetical protein